MLDLTKIFQEGALREWTKRVDVEDTVGNASQALNHLLATDACVRLMVRGATDLVDPRLPEGFVSVGKRSEIVHESAALLGMTITLRLTLRKVEAHRLVFDFLCFDRQGQIARGNHHRLVVGREALLSKLEDRANRLLGVR